MPTARPDMVPRIILQIVSEHSCWLFCVAIMLNIGEFVPKNADYIILNDADCREWILLRCVLGPERFQLPLRAKPFSKGSQDASWTWMSAFGKSMRTDPQTDVVGDMRIKNWGSCLRPIMKSVQSIKGLSQSLVISKIIKRN